MISYITGGAAVVAAGAYLKWAAWPLAIAYRLGREVGQLRERARARQ
jgi:hypothetical protein